MTLQEFIAAGYTVEIDKDARVQGRIKLEDVATSDDLFMAGTEIIDYTPAEHYEYAEITILNKDGVNIVEQFTGTYTEVMYELKIYIGNLTH